MSIFRWFQRSSPKTPQQAFAADIRKTLLNAAKSIRQAHKRDAFDKMMAFPTTFGSVIGAIRKMYGENIVDLDSPAAHVVRGVGTGGEAQRAVQDK